MVNKNIIFLFLIIFVPFAYSAGVSPSYYDIDFKPNLEEEFTFSFFFDPGANPEFEIIGDLADYSKVISSKKLSNNRYSVLVKVSLPEIIEIPGLHILRISGKEISDSDGGISLSLSVRGLIRVRVPYPAKYAELELKTELINQGEDLPYELTIYSRGEEDIIVNPYLEIKDLDGVLVKKIELPKKEIPSTKNEVYKGTLSTKTYSPGDYNLIATVKYDGEKSINASTIIRLGELKTRILNYTSTFEKDKVGPFTITVGSLWNNPIENVYADVEVLGYPHKSFTTPSLTINPWGERTLLGYLDSIGIEEEILQLKINVHYAGKITSQIVNVSQEKHFNWVILLIIVGSLVILATIMFLILYIIKLKGKSENAEKKK